MFALACVIGGLTVGCGSNTPIEIESSVSADDEAFANERQQEYNSEEYANQLQQQSKK